MRFINFFKDLAKYLYKTDDINYKQIQKVFLIMHKNMTPKEITRYNYWFWKCLTAIRKQLFINEPIKKRE
ncbi:hypothetical protein LCGC14_0876590 [marine sediment metagenome]|uniref:Uncharacterized protein n=1 Tax=marine sediment metagenome TaxID=412755 RepID=A0A0F9PNS0_9ZZZZ|nr:hypothetical protein [bacterium]